MKIKVEFALLYRLYSFFLIVFFVNCKSNNDTPESILLDYNSNCSECIWFEEFDGPTLNDNHWNYEEGYGNNGWGNDEWQKYVRSNTEIIDGQLVITADTSNEKIGKRDGSILSSRITTQGKIEYGPGMRVEAKIKAPWGQGIWPAFWSIGSNFTQLCCPKCGEIDIMEFIGGNPISNIKNSTNHSILHWDETGHHKSSSNSIKINKPLSSEYHIYKLIWTNEYIESKLNGKRVHKVDIRPEKFNIPFRNSHFFILNIAVGGRWPGPPNNNTLFPQKMYVDYIRVYELND